MLTGLEAAAAYGAATFDLIACPANADTAALRAPDTVISCTAGDRSITQELLTGIQPGDLLRVTGTLVQPRAPGEPARLTVDVLEVLDTVLLPVLNDMALDRYGDYIVVFTTNSDAVPVFTALGQWAGMTEIPDAIGMLIDVHERVNGGDA